MSVEKLKGSGGRESKRAPDGGEPSGLWRWVCESRTVSKLRSRRSRRLLVAAFLAVLVALPIVGSMTSHAGVVVVLFIPYMVGSVLLSASTYGMFDRPIASLDERQQRVRRNLFREPYMTGATIGLLSGMVIAFAFDSKEPLMMGAILAIFGVLFFLPTIVLAWTMRDERNDEE